MKIFISIFNQLRTMSDNRVEGATSSMENGLNCSQAIFSIYGQYLGMDRDTCLKITSVFGGGINRTGNVCGAVTGALMAIGLKHAEVESDSVASEFTKKFRERNGTIICRELIDHNLLTVIDRAHAFESGAFENCPKFVKDAAEILEKML